MAVYDRIDGVLIDSGERGFELILSGHNAEYKFQLDGKAAEELQAAVATEISHWMTAKRLGQATFVDPAVGGNPYPANEPYDQDDPKHPDYHDTMSGIWDNRADK